MKKVMILIFCLITATAMFGGCNKEINQLAKPKSGDTVAKIVVRNYGSIYVRFFEDEAPKAVENFITHAKNGYYDGLSFYRIIDHSIIESGDPTESGNGGESIWKDAFKDEFGVVMVPVRAIAEGLGLSVTWNDESQSVKVGNDVSFKIGEDNYTKADTAIKLDTAPMLKDDRTFVPLSFFNEVLGFSAYESEGKVIVE
jgi:hypothetical protein